MYHRKHKRISIAPEAGSLCMSNFAFAQFTHKSDDALCITKEVDMPRAGLFIKPIYVEIHI